MQFTKPSKTQQHFKESTKINNIVGQYLNTGKLPQTQRQPMFGDFTSLDFHQMQNKILDINGQFMSLPSKLRARFANSPYQLIRFVENPANYAESIKLGLIQKPVPEEKTEEKAEAQNEAKKPEIPA